MKKSNMNINKNYTSLLQQIQANSESEKELLEEIKIILKDATEPKKDRFSQFVKISLAIAFVLLGKLLLFTALIDFKILWGNTLIEHISYIILFILLFSLIPVGVGIYKEKDRNYIISVLSAIVSIIALIISII